jgi:hypothetical protein
MAEKNKIFEPTGILVSIAHTCHYEGQGIMSHAL